MAKGVEGKCVLRVLFEVDGYWLHLISFSFVFFEVDGNYRLHFNSDGQWVVSRLGSPIAGQDDNRCGDDDQS